MAQKREYEQSTPLDCREQHSHHLRVGTLLSGFQLLESPYKQAEVELTMIIQENGNMINFLNAKVKVGR